VKAIQVVNVPAHSRSERVYYMIPAYNSPSEEIMAVVDSYQRYGYYVESVHCKAVEIFNGYKRKRILTVDI